MFHAAALLALFALTAALSACADAIPTLPAPPLPGAQPAAVNVDDSLCALIDSSQNREDGQAEQAATSDVLDAIEQGAAVNARCAEGNSPLHLAAAVNDLSVVELLIERGADVHAVNREGATPLIAAAGLYVGDEGIAPVLQLLLAAGADVNAAADYGLTALHRAAATYAWDSIAVLLEYDSLIDAQDYHGNTPLHYASRVGNFVPGTVPLLLAAGANPNAVNVTGETPLHVAATIGATDAIHPLLEHGADVNAVDLDGRTPLHTAAREPYGYLGLESDPAVAELLLDAGANPRLQDRHGNTVCDLLSRHLSDPDVRRRICEAR